MEFELSSLFTPSQILISLRSNEIANVRGVNFFRTNVYCFMKSLTFNF